MKTHGKSSGLFNQLAKGTSLFGGDKNGIESTPTKKRAGLSNRSTLGGVLANDGLKTARLPERNVERKADTLIAHGDGLSGNQGWKDSFKSSANFENTF